MDYKGLIKKYWFVGLLSLIFVAFIIVYSVETINEKKASEINVQAKTDENGESVLYSINGEDYTIRDLYNELSATNLSSTVFYEYQRLVMKDGVKSNDNMEALATANVANMKKNYDADLLDAQIRYYGFDGIKELHDFFIMQLKTRELAKQNILAHEEDILVPWYENNHPRLVSHILVKVADITKTENEDGTYTLTANPTEEETAKLNEVLEALKTRTFEEVAATYSEDSSASKGGSLGIVTDTSVESFVKEFKDAIPSGDNEMSEVVLSEYGYHIILTKASSLEALKEFDDLYQAIYNEDSKLYYQPIFDKGAELGYEIAADVKDQIMSELGLKEAE